MDLLVIQGEITISQERTSIRVTWAFNIRLLVLRNDDVADVESMHVIEKLFHANIQIPGVSNEHLYDDVSPKEINIDIKEIINKEKEKSWSFRKRAIASAKDGTLKPVVREKSKKI